MPADPDAVLLDGWVDPATVFLGGPALAEHAFWLDAGPDASEGWSWVGTGTPADLPREVRCDGGDAPEWGPFTGGWVGWLSYEAGAARADAPVATGGEGDAWLRVERFVAFDHARRRVWAMAPTGEDFAATVVEWAARGIRLSSSPPPDAPARTATARDAPDEYAALIARCREAIRRGDAYQLCLTTRFDVAGRIDPVETALRLRRVSPAHHGGVILTAGRALVSASPEQFLTAGGGVLRTRPIKGTRPRGDTPESDAALAAELHGSEKERAENVMIVDLMRNDLSRVCDPGTIRVERLLEVESYPAVHQLVSTVSGRLTSGTTVGDVLDATFPAGSMTGAPKLSAMTILHELEGAPRGVYAGAFGWIGRDGALDLAMVIRSIVVGPQGVSVGAGGGIVWLSDAAAEVAEVALKARAPLAALGAEVPDEWAEAGADGVGAADGAGVGDAGGGGGDDTRL